MASYDDNLTDCTSANMSDYTFDEVHIKKEPGP